MTTHFHLLVRSLRGTISEAMRRITNAYVRWFNRSRRRDDAWRRASDSAGGATCGPSCRADAPAAASPLESVRCGARPRGGPFASCRGVDPSRGGDRTRPEPIRDPGSASPSRSADGRRGRIRGAGHPSTSRCRPAGVRRRRASDSPSDSSRGRERPRVGRASTRVRGRVRLLRRAPGMDVHFTVVSCV